MSRQRLTHQAIAASAGSGKTFRLAHRYIRLMDHGVSPDRMCALTFSRKAAGEILDSIVGYLCRAADTEEACRTAAQHIQRPHATQADFLRLLRRFVDNLHRTHIGTLDSFIVSVLRAFPAELGICMDFQVTDNETGAAQGTRLEALNEIFHPRHVRPAEQTAFLEAFKLATFGREEKQVERNLVGFIDEHRLRYRALPDREGWGNPERLWPGRCPWLEALPDRVGDAQSLLHARLAGKQWAPSTLEAFLQFIDFCATYGQTSLWDARKAEGTLGKRIFEQAAEGRQGGCSVRYNRQECTLTDEEASALFHLVHHVVGTEVRRALSQTRGIFDVLDMYETRYDGVIRQTGKFTFEDAQYMLTPVNSCSGGAVISRSKDGENRLYIDYRLDCQLDHWLLDEFQDTSDLQWAVLCNVADEILQDAEGDRSFFYVGDVKQAIYGWRGGNARLFGKLLDEYPHIETLPIRESYRSAQPVIDMVNAVFGQLPGAQLGEKVLEQWSAGWEPHTCADSVPHRGYSALLELQPEDMSGKIGKQDIFRAAVGVLREVDPVQRGLSCAVLVRSNAAGAEFVDLLRRTWPTCPVVLEGKKGIRDNAAVELLLALVKFAWHPGDTLAWEHVQMSPLADVLVERGGNRQTLPLDLLAQVYEQGFEAFVREWTATLWACVDVTDFEAQRLDMLARAAGEFDAQGTPDGDAFLAHIDAYQVREMAHQHSVRVMTIHQAKGLGFDLVILPDLMGAGLRAGSAPTVELGRSDEDNRPRWALHMPRKIIAEQDPVLAEQAKRRADDACLEELCVLYVALTRARQGMVVLTADPGRTFNAAALVRQALADDPGAREGADRDLPGAKVRCLWERGDPAWFAEEAGPPEETEPSPPPWPAEFAERPSQRRHLRRIEPSLLAEPVREAARLFHAENRDVLDFGRAMHELFEHMTWSDETRADQVIKAWRPGAVYSEAVRRDVVRQFRQAMQAPDIAAALARPRGKAVLWRERNFELVLKDGWVSGTFDRVVVELSKDGVPVRATIIDFKTNRLKSPGAIARAVSSYSPQLLLYRRALTSILKLDTANIRLQLVFTVPAVVRDVEEA